MSVIKIDHQIHVFQKKNSRKIHRKKYRYLFCISHRTFIFEIEGYLSISEVSNDLVFKYFIKTEIPINFYPIAILDHLFRVFVFIFRNI